MSFERPPRPDKKPQSGASRCCAPDCPCRGTIGNEPTRLYCEHHHFEPKEKWPLITQKLHNHKWLRAFIFDVLKMHAANQNWRDFAVKFWARNDDFCVPDPREDVVPYCTRMRGELSHRIGLTSNRPAVRLPKPVVPSGQFARGEIFEKDAA